jgi:DNA-binding MarR family transcriptional regulator
MTSNYIEAISLIERLHRHFLEVVKQELNRLKINDINSVQGLMLFNLFNIGDAEITIGDLTLRGCYLGTNVSYNAKKMVATGYLEKLEKQERPMHDQRLTRVRLTDKGRALCAQLNGMHHRHINMLSSETPIKEADMEVVIMTLRRLEQFWVRASDRYR